MNGLSVDTREREVVLGYAVGHDELIEDVRNQLRCGWRMEGVSESRREGKDGMEIHYTVVWSRLRHLTGDEEGRVREAEEEIEMRRADG